MLRVGQKTSRNDGFFFDEKSHTYLLCGNVLPSVTQILTRSGIVNSFYYTDFARDRGQAVHQAIFLDILDDLHEESLHPTVKGFFNGWKKFCVDTMFIPNIEISEKPTYHPIYLYGMKPDLIGVLNGRTVLIDVKTGDASSARYQTAAYKEAPEIKVLDPDRFDLRLSPDGKYKLNRHGCENDFAVFLNALKTVQCS